MVRKSKRKERLLPIDMMCLLRSAHYLYSVLLRTYLCHLPTLVFLVSYIECHHRSAFTYAAFLKRLNELITTPRN